MPASELKIVIPALNKQMMKVKIKGVRPMVQHKWSEKAMKMILDKQMKKASKGREIRDPKQEYKDSYHYNEKGKIAFPAGGVKKAIVTAARNIPGVTMSLLRGALFVLGDKDDLIEVKFKSERMRTDMVKINIDTADLRFRGELSDWTMDFLVEFNADVISPEQIMNLIQTAGFSSGLGEMRPEKTGFRFGTFEIVTE